MLLHAHTATWIMCTFVYMQIHIHTHAHRHLLADTLGVTQGNNMHRMACGVPRELTGATS